MRASAQRAGGASDSIYLVLKAEHTRASTPEVMSLIAAATRSRDTGLQRVAVRTLGRFEKPALLDQIIPLLDAASAAVRAQAAEAVAQAQFRTTGDPIIKAEDALADRLAVEKDPDVRGAIARSLGRLRYTTVDAARKAEHAMRTVLAERDPLAVSGAAKGFDWLARTQTRRAPLEPETIALLQSIVTNGASAGTPAQAELRAFARRMALSALTSAAAAGPVLAQATTDPDVQVRRFAQMALVPSQPLAERLPFINRGLNDSSAIVRFEALTSYGKGLRSDPCAPVLLAVKDRDPKVSLLALDLLGGPCDQRDSAVATLKRHIARNALIAYPKPDVDRSWIATSHALVSLAKIAPDSASALVPVGLRSTVAEQRRYAALAATAMQRADLLMELAADSDNNVREAAIDGLSKVSGHAADSIYIAALTARGYQVVIAAAKALAGTPNKPAAIDALLQALKRITEEDKDTGRDPRVAIVDRLNELGGPAQIAALTPYLTDFDPKVAAGAARAIAKWGGPVTAVDSMAPPREPPFPTQAELKALDKAMADVTIKGVGTFTLTLFTDEAPATVARFAHLARTGYYNNKVLQRVEGNFVVQGGGTDANEYMGDSLYMRDEIGRPSNLRGTIATSSRGHDTGDAQIYINLVDNPRLDHTYTVWGEVTSGMSVVDRILEGDVIERITIRTGKPRGP